MIDTIMLALPAAASRLDCRHFSSRLSRYNHDRFARHVISGYVLHAALKSP
jgi:hypothetical protein